MTHTMSLADVRIPDRFLRLATQWHGGQNCYLYAVSSSGGLYLGTQRPMDDDGQPMSDREWHVHLWDSLSSDISYAADLAEGKSGHPSNRGKIHKHARRLRQFEAYADRVSARLRVVYRLDV